MRLVSHEGGHHLLHALVSDLGNYFIYICGLFVQILHLFLNFDIHVFRVNFTPLCIDLSINLTRQIVIIVVLVRLDELRDRIFFGKYILLFHLIISDLVHFVLLFERILVLDASTAEQPEATTVALYCCLERF